MDSQYFINNFNTDLSPDDEVKYSNWVREQSNKYGRDVSKDAFNYDMRGYWLNNIKNILLQKINENPHFPDTYKKPNHPTFSVESIYHDTKGPWNVPFRGGVWSEDGKTYTPSKEMLQYTHSKDDLTNYFKQQEPDAVLKIDSP